MAIKATIFDAYGTLLDVGSATHQLVASNRYPALVDKAAQLSDIWRSRQLQYSWLRSLMGAYVPFWQCTCDALDFALDETGLSGDGALRDDLLSLYRVLSAYDDAVPFLETIAQTPKIGRAILSNGNHDMLQDAVNAAGLSPHLDVILSVEDVGVFKPDPAVYQMGCDQFHAAPDEILFFSSNGWDIAGASQFGYQTIWVNRTNQTAEQLGKGPDFMVSHLHDAWRIAAPLIR